MHTSIRRVVVAGAVAALSALGVSGAGASGAATQAERSVGHPPVTASRAAAVPGTQLWVQLYNGPANYIDAAALVAVSPRGDRVFVTGSSYNDSSTNPSDYATVAYNAATGAQLWVKRYNGANGYDEPHSMVVSPRGDRVFVTGRSDGYDSFEDYATVAYNAVTGAQLWVQRYSGPGVFPGGRATSVAVSPSGGKVFVTGWSYNTSDTTDYATIAYNAVTGAQLWVQRYTTRFHDDARSVAVSPGGGTVFVTGRSSGGYGTVAYNAATGTQLWVQQYKGPSPSSDDPASVAVSPSGGMVFVTGSSPAANSFPDYATVAYNAATGTQLWVKRYNGPANEYDVARSMAVSASGSTVFVTGASDGSTQGTTPADYATVAYNAATGAQLWVKRYNGPAKRDDYAASVAVSGDRVFVTGASWNTSGTNITDYATVAYNAATGAQLWVKRYNGPADLADGAASVAVSPSGDRVFVTGTSQRRTSRGDYATIAYSG